MVERHTILVTSRFARQWVAIDAARTHVHGRQIMSPAQAAARLAGGFLQPVDRDALKDAVRAVLEDSDVDLGTLNAIRNLPGMVRAVTGTLQKAWAAGVDLATSHGDGGAQRLVELATLERAVCSRLPGAMQRSAQLIALSLTRLAHAPAVIGPTTLFGIPDVDPLWRPWFTKLAEAVPVSWQFGHFELPEWIDATAITAIREDAATPEMVAVACANPRHEVLEALRWARGLIAEGAARPEEIAIAAPATNEWDSHMATIAADSSLPLSFASGRPALTTRDGQAAAALAEVLLDGPSQRRMRRLVPLIRDMTPSMEILPRDWYRILPIDAPLLDSDSWRTLIDAITDWPDGNNFGDALSGLIDIVERGHAEAGEIGETLLGGRALAIWRQALREGPTRALDVSLLAIRIDDGVDPNSAVVWCSAADLAAVPRPFVRLLGLTSRGWPRTASEDPLLPAHILDPNLLDPVPVPERDRRDFNTIVRATSNTLILSRPRRDAEGRQTGASPLLRTVTIPEETYLRRERIPEHTVSEADRMMAHTVEFATSDRARSAGNCWRDWHIETLTPHDGLVRADHPIIRRALAGPFSATALRRLVRDPLGYVWSYALRWDAPRDAEEPLSLDALEFGNLAHRALELALGDLEHSGGVATADEERISGAVTAAVQVAGDAYATEKPIPPRVIWRRQLAEISVLTLDALTWDERPLDGQRSFAEVPFGYSHREIEAAPELPWNPRQEVRIPGTDLVITGLIDRLDISDDGTQARVTDYKTGRIPRKEFELNGGAELQRCLYAFAVQALLGDAVTHVSARLLYTRDGGRLLDMADPAGTLSSVARYLVAGREGLLAGNALIGKDSGERDDNPLTFALPGNAKEVYFEIKKPLATARLAPLPELWDMS